MHSLYQLQRICTTGSTVVGQTMLNQNCVISLHDLQKHCSYLTWIA
jgi:hypothetical protein